MPKFVISIEAPEGRHDLDLVQTIECRSAAKALATVQPLKSAHPKGWTIKVSSGDSLLFRVDCNGEETAPGH